MGGADQNLTAGLGERVPFGGGPRLVRGRHGRRRLVEVLGIRQAMREYTVVPSWACAMGSAGTN